MFSLFLFTAALCLSLFVALVGVFFFRLRNLRIQPVVPEFPHGAIAGNSVVRSTTAMLTDMFGSLEP